MMQTDGRTTAGGLAVSREVARVAAVVAASVVGVRGSSFSSGSGVVWRGGGLVISNHHVVPGASAEVVLVDGKRLPGQVVGRDERLDLVALEVDGLAGLVPAAIGDSSSLRVGGLVVAVGNPLGERNAVTLGVVSAVPVAGRPLQVAIRLWPGNSGGALADANGRVVGVPNMVTGAGLALAIASQTVEDFLRGGGTGRHAGEERVAWL